MALEELEAAMVQYRDFLQKAKGKLPSFSESGPASMTLVEEVFKVLQDQEQRIEKLESQSGKFV
jgi:hypothetical protein